MLTINSLASFSFAIKGKFAAGKTDKDDPATIKTSAFNVGINRGYFVNTSGGAVTATLPASPNTGDMVRFIDLNATFDTANLTVARNGKKIQGDTSDLTVATERAGFALVFSGDTQGWLLQEK